MSSQVSGASTKNHPQTSSKQANQHTPSSQIERFLGIFGPKASGKTVYLTALCKLDHFSREDESAFHLSVPDGDPTYRYLNRRWQQMAQQRQWIDPTELRAPEEMLFHAKRQDPQGRRCEYRVVLPDACGELMDRAEEYAKIPQLKEEYFRKLKQSHGVALFVPGNLAPHSSEAAELKQAFDPLFDALTRERDQQGIKQPIAVIVTMWDIHSPYPQDYAQEEQKARDYIRAVLGYFVEGLEQLASKDFVKVFPISATGPLQPTPPHSLAQIQHLPPPVQFQPYRIKAPIHWLLSAYEQRLLENSERAYEKAIQRPKLRQLTELKKQINSSLQEFAPSPQKDKLEHISDQVSRLVLTLQRQNRNRWIGSILCVFLFALGFITAQDWFSEKGAISKADEFLQDPKTTQMHRLYVLDRLCSHRPAPTQWFFGCWQSIALKKTHVIKAGASAAWKELLPLPPQPSLSQLQERAKELETFLQTYPNVPESTIAKQRLAQIKQRLEQKRRSEQRSLWNRFLARSQTARSALEIEQSEKICKTQFLEKDEYAWMRFEVLEVCNKLQVGVQNQKNAEKLHQSFLQLKQQITERKNDIDFCVKGTNAFLSQYQETNYAQETRSIQEGCIKLGLEQKLANIKALALNPQSTGLCVKEAIHYLSQHPNSPHAEEVKNLQERCAKFELEQKVAKMKALALDPQSTSLCVKETVAFLSQYPNSLHTEEVKNLQENCIKSDFKRKIARIKATIAEHPQDTSLCIKETNGFLSQHPSSTYAEEVKNLQENCIKSELERKVAKIKEKIAQEPKDTNLCIKETNEFLSQHPNTVHTAEITLIQDNCKKKEDDAYWAKEVTEYKQENPTEYKYIIARAQRYLQRTEYKGHTQEAIALIEKTRTAWDRSEYQQIQRLWQEYRPKLDATAIDRVHKRCEEYARKGPTKAMLSAVQKWLTWYKKIRDGVRFRLIIDGIEIGKEWASWTNWPDVVVFVRIGSQEKKSKEFVDLHVETKYHAHDETNHLVKKELLPQTLGPFLWRYGSDNIHIRMINTEMSQGTQREYSREWTTTMERYNIYLLQGKACVRSGFCLYLRTEPLSSEDHVPDASIFPDYQ